MQTPLGNKKEKWCCETDLFEFYHQTNEFMQLEFCLTFSISNTLIHSMCTQHTDQNIMKMVSCWGREQKYRMVGWMDKLMKALPHRLLQSHDCSGSKHLRTAVGGGERQRSEELFNCVHHIHIHNKDVF